MTHLVNDAKEKMEMTYRILDMLEGVIADISGERHPDDKDEPQKMADSLIRDMDRLGKNLDRMYEDVKVLKAMVSGNEVTATEGMGRLECLTERR